MFSAACSDGDGDEGHRDDPLVATGAAATSAAPLREDTWVRGGAYGDRNYGGSKSVTVLAGPSSATAFALFKFDLRGVSTQAKRATLRVYGSASSPTIVEARRTWNEWSESRVTFRNAPNLGDYYAEQRVTSAAYYTWDVTQWANLNLGNDAASIALAANPLAAHSRVTFNAREAGFGAATLNIEMADASPPDAGSRESTGAASPDAGSPEGGSETLADAGAKTADASASTEPDAGSGTAPAAEPTDGGSACSPRACASSCGSVADGCGGSIDCGPCAAPSAPARKMFLGTNFWRHSWGNGPIDYFKPGVDWATTNDPWQPQLISDLSYAKVLRFMDWGPTNGSRLVNWSERVPKAADQRHHGVPLSAWDGAEEPGEGVAYEWQIDLANRAGADFWVNIPHAASDDFVLQLAKLIHAQLDSGRKIYIEYSNEVWNSGFYQFRYAADRFKQLGLPQVISYQDKSVYIDGWLGYATYRSLQVFDLFEQVFGQDSPRLVKVLASQLGFANWPDYVNTWGDLHPLVVQHMAALRNPTYNPKGIKVNAYAMAPYWGGATVSEMREGVELNVERMAEAKRALAADGAGIALICYEGGQDGSNQVANARDPAIYQLTYDAYDKFKPLIDGAFLTYTHVGWDSQHAWGLKPSTNASLADSHKYRATLDWAKDN